MRKINRVKINRSIENLMTVCDGTLNRNNEIVPQSSIVMIAYKVFRGLRYLNNIEFSSENKYESEKV